MSLACEMPKDPKDVGQLPRPRRTSRRLRMGCCRVRDGRVDDFAWAAAASEAGYRVPCSTLNEGRADGDATSRAKGTRLTARAGGRCERKKFVDLHYFVDEFWGPSDEEFVALRNSAACGVQDTHRATIANQDDSRAGRVRENASARLPEDPNSPCYAYSMILKHLSDSEVLSSTLALIGERRRITAELVAHLVEIDQRRLHLRASYSSLYDFCTNKLEMSSGSACRHINGARLAQLFPVVLEHLRDGTLSLSNLELLRKHLTPDNRSELFAAAARKKKEQVAEMLAARFPKPDLPERIAPTGGEPLSLGLDGSSPASRASSPAGELAELRGRVQPLSESRYAVQFTVSAELRDKMERGLDLMSHSNPQRLLSVMIDRALDLLVARLESQKHGSTSRPRKSRGVRHGDTSAATRREVHDRDGGQCTYVGPDGRRCTAKAFLQYDHTFARGRGGGGGPDNIAEMCFGHNQLRAEEEYGPQFIADKAAARKPKSKSNRSIEPTPSSASGNHPRQQRCRTEEEAAVFDKLHKALVGLGFQRKQATEAIERLSTEWPLTDTPMDQLLRQALWLLVPPSPGVRRR